ncbi:hypothetical protein WP50_07650, partial [Lactiplantibacillus plantarum]
MKIVIGTKIKEQRQQHEWSQQTVAERLHVSRQTILQRVTISYRCRKRLSPFDFNPDYFQLILKTNAQTYQLECALKASDYLP